MVDFLEKEKRHDIDLRIYDIIKLPRILYELWILFKVDIKSILRSMK